jgi:hypothetical protein
MLLLGLIKKIMNFCQKVVLMFSKVRTLVFLIGGHMLLSNLSKKLVIFVNCLFIVFCMLWSKVYQVINVVSLLVVDGT